MENGTPTRTRGGAVKVTVTELGATVFAESSPGRENAPVSPISPRPKGFSAGMTVRASRESSSDSALRQETLSSGAGAPRVDSTTCKNSSPSSSATGKKHVAERLPNASAPATRSLEPAAPTLRRVMSRVASVSSSAAPSKESACVRYAAVVSRVASNGACTATSTSVSSSGLGRAPGGACRSSSPAGPAVSRPAAEFCAPRSSTTSVTGGPRVRRRTYTTPRQSCPGATRPTGTTSSGPSGVSASSPPSPKVTSTVSASDEDAPEESPRLFVRNESAAASIASPVLTTARGSAQFSPRSAGPARRASRDTRGAAPRRSSAWTPTRTSVMKSGSLKPLSESFSFSSRGGASRSGPDLSAARNTIPVSRVTTTAVARTGCPHLGVTSTATRCHAFGFSAAGTSELVSRWDESCSPAARRHAYKGSENSTATDATFTSKGRAHFSAAVNRVRSPGTARFVRNPATHRNARSTPLARAPSRASPPTATTLSSTAAPVSVIAARAACAAASGSNAPCPEASTAPFPAPSAASSRHVSRCARFFLASGTRR
mmetsp:Transcript_10833/g.46137  ORF Transcript_10833/g.46137 Transcript_10833/m.46137 type:complete len:546 (-) Transcript_10833:1269-2906(-)